MYMKKILSIIAAATLMSACGLVNNVTVTPTPEAEEKANAAAAQINAVTEQAEAVQATVATPVDAGRAAGNSILALYNQYVADGKKFDYKNLSNISNTLILLANCADLKDNVKNTTYLKEYGQGLMQSAAGLITEENVEAVTGSLTEIATQYADKAAAVTSSAAEKLTTAAQTAAAVNNMLNLFRR